MQTTYIKDNIITILGIQALPLKERDQIVTRAAELLQWRIIRYVFTHLKEDSQREFMSLVEKSASEEEMNLFIAKQIPNIDEIVEQQVDAYKKELTGLAHDIDQEIGIS